MLVARPAFVCFFAGLAFVGGERRGRRFRFRNALDNLLRLLLWRPEDLMPQAHPRTFWSQRLFDICGWRGNAFARRSFVYLFLMPTRGGLRRAGRTWRRGSLLGRSRCGRSGLCRFALRSPRWFHQLRSGRHFDPQILGQTVPVAGCRLRQRWRRRYDARLAARRRGLGRFLFFGGRCGSGPQLASQFVPTR